MPEEPDLLKELSMVGYWVDSLYGCNTEWDIDEIEELSKYIYSIPCILYICMLYIVTYSIPYTIEICMHILSAIKCASMYHARWG